MLSKAIELAGLGIWQYDIPQDRVSWSPEVYKIYGMDPTGEAPKIQDIFYHADPQEKAHVEQVIQEAIKTGDPYDMDCSIITKSGQIKYVNAKGRAYFDESGIPKYLFGTISDISKRKEKEQELRFSDFTIESISDGIYWIDQDAKFFRVNQGATQLLGYKKEELRGLSGKDINPDFTKAMSQEYWKKTREKGAFTFETSHRKKDGSAIPVEITNNIMIFDNQEFRVSIVRDITERKKREQEILNALEEVERLKNRLQEENIYLREEIKLDVSFSQIITNSDNFRKVLKQVEQVAATEATVLITGESGTGKELLARAIHHLSTRNDRPLIRINCAALPENLIESELFGHEKGAFTGALQKRIGRFELADGATLFLDEIGELPLELQAKLLRVLQEGEFERLGGSQTIKTDARIIAATNRDIELAVETGTFREDLYYRLNVFPIESIPLRQRKSDIPALVKHFIDKYASKSGKIIQSISRKAMDALVAYSWPGNIRELENLIERAVIITAGEVIEFGTWLPKKAPSKVKTFTLEEIEKAHIKEALKLTNGKISGKDGAASILGINPHTLYSRLKKYDMLPKKQF